MPITDAMRARRTVRAYTDQALPADLVARLRARIGELNAAHGTDIRLMIDDARVYGTLWHALRARTVRNCLVMAGPDAPGANPSDLDERLGYCGAALMLFLQEQGLNTWWAGGTFSARAAAKASGTTGRIVGVVSFGYGTTRGVPHSSKSAAEVSTDEGGRGKDGTHEGAAPTWFTEGVEAALLAPTAYGKQAFTIRGQGRNVSITCDNGKWSGADLGLVKHFFEAGAGRENFDWR